LAHRIGLIPIKADARFFKEKLTEDKFSSENSIKFTLKIKCVKKEEFKD